MDLPERDLAGNHRIQYGGRRFLVDMGAYEAAIARCELARDPWRAILIWSSRPDWVYYVSWSPDLRTWSQAVRVLSAGDTTTSWAHSGLRTTLPARFYRIHESSR